MSLCEIRWLSKVLDKRVATSVILPDAGTGPFAVYYLLHGLSDDNTAWQRQSRIEVYAANLPLIIVMPDGLRGYYTDNDDGPAYGRYIGEELVEMVKRNFPAKSEPSARCIGGMSMGGYGALRIALGYAGKYISANSHSGGLMSGSRDTPPTRFPEARRIFGEHPRGSNHDLVHLAQKAQAEGRLPQMRIDCGRDDFLLQDNREFHQALEKLNIRHEYEEFAGNHDSNYWDEHVREALAFHASILGLRQIPMGETT